MILIANLVYFHPLFTEFQNLDPKALNFADLSGWVEPQVVNFGHLKKFNVQRVKKEYENVLYGSLNDWIIVKLT